MVKPTERVLFVCGKARIRSAAAAALAPDLLGVEADCGGLTRDADVPLSAEQVDWADTVAVMERSQVARLKRQFGPRLKGKRAVCLDVPDRFNVMDPGLIALLTRQFSWLR